ncbi:MFS transporter [Streptomyces hoynatensis]|uniref:MFS transporter n=2 Tax=Streptomyces hoynatensis TaxID=1141874 RepID=A0A3A9ZG67_9ACTN|nr:MFS transporter [Streptomyces hoynatensis]
MLAVLLSAWFLAQFDFFVVNVAAPSLERDLGAGPAALQLIVGGYAFAYASGMITGGRLGERYGQRRLFVGGMAAFALASLLCGLAAGPWQLVAARLAQGLAAAVMVPQVLAVITAAFPGPARARALGWHGVTGGLGSIAGQVLGGLLLEQDVLGLGWRAVFLVNVPVGLIAAPLAARLLPPPAPRAGARGQDPLGAVGIAAALALLLVPLTLGQDQGWPAWTWLCLGAGVPLGGLVAAWQRRLHARGGAPVVDVTLFLRPSFRAGIASVTAFMAYFASFMFTLTQLLQGGLGLDAFEAGLVFAPSGLLFGVTALLGARLVARYGMRVVVGGGAVTALGLGLLALRLLAAGEGAGLGWLVPAVALVGLGNGLVLPQLIGVALLDVSARQAGIGAAVVTTTQQFASAAGVAVIGTVFFALAGPGGGHAAAMARCALIDLALVLAVVLLVAHTARRARPGEHAPRAHAGRTAIRASGSSRR